MSRSKLQAARELINELNYDAARAILRSLPDDPIAQEWLAKLDKIAPETSPTVRVKSQAPSYPVPPPPSSIRQLPVNPQQQPQTASPPITPLPKYEPEPAFPELEQTPLSDAPALQGARWRLRWLMLWRLIWGGLALIAAGWIFYGIYSTVTDSSPIAGQVREAISGFISNVTGSVNEQVQVSPGVTETAQDAGDAVSSAVSVAIFLCSGMPLLWIFLAFYRRATLLHREERRHKEVLETMQVHARSA